MHSDLYSEGALPTDLADRVNASFPLGFMMNGFAQRATEAIAEKDKCVFYFSTTFYEETSFV